MRWVFLLASSASAAPQLTSQEQAIAWAMKGLDPNVKLNKICDAIYEHRKVEEGKDAVRPTKPSISNLFKPKKKKKKKSKDGRGRPRNTTEEEDKELIKVVKKLHKANVGKDVTANA